MSGPRTFSGDELKGRNLEGADLAGCEFYRCDLSDTRLARCNLGGARFVRCCSVQGFVDFKGADLRGASLKGCVFPDVRLENAILADSEIVMCRFPKADLTNCVFDNSRIGGLNIPRARLYLASFRNVRIEDIVYEPAKKIGLSRIVRALWRATSPSQGTVFTAGTEMSPFIAFCARQYRLEQLLMQLLNRPFYGRIPSLLALLLFGIISDFGTSLRRWIVSCCAIIAAFAAIYHCFPATGTGAPPGLSDSLFLSLECFLSICPSSAGILRWSAILEAVLGYFMLGILVSILTTRFFERW